MWGVHEDPMWGTVHEDLSTRFGCRRINLHKNALFHCNGIRPFSGYKHQANAAHCSVIRYVQCLSYGSLRLISKVVVTLGQQFHADGISTTLSPQVITNSRVTRLTSARHCLHLPLERLAVTNKSVVNSLDNKNTMAIHTLTRICLSL